MTSFIDNISIGLDLATALSITGAAIAFIHNNVKSAQKSISDEIERERVVKMSSGRAELGRLIKMLIDSASSEEQMLKTLHKIDEFIRFELWPNFALYTEQEVISEVENIIAQLEEASNDINNHDMFDLRSFATKLIKLETVMMHELRQLMNKESESQTKAVIDRYIKERYGLTK